MSYKNFNIFDEFLMIIFDNIPNACQTGFLNYKEFEIYYSHSKILR